MARSKKAQAAIDDALSIHGVAEQVGIGVDLLEIARMRKVLERTPSFKNRAFTEAEQLYCDSKSNPPMHYAVRFAAKEAVSKALGTGFSNGIELRDIEIARQDGKRPEAILHGRALEVAKELGIVQLPISLSHTSDEAIACAIALTETSARVAVDRKDPTQELLEQFKDAKSILDDIGKLDLK